MTPCRVTAPGLWAPQSETSRQGRARHLRREGAAGSETDWQKPHGPWGPAPSTATHTCWPGGSQPARHTPDSTSKFPSARLCYKQGQQIGFAGCSQDQPQGALGAGSTKKILLCREDQFGP